MGFAMEMEEERNKTSAVALSSGSLHEVKIQLHNFTFTRKYHKTGGSDIFAVC